MTRQTFPRRDPERINVVLDELRTYWEKNPDLRLGQIIYQAVDSARGRGRTITVNDVAQIEDDQLLNHLSWEGPETAFVFKRVP